MVREVDLVSYLPPFLAEYQETRLTLEAENPEFNLAWKAAHRVLKNEFIVTADEYGISRFETVLGIHPDPGDGLEDRRARLLYRWYTSYPYTWRMLLQKLASIPGAAGMYSISHNFCRGYEVFVDMYTDSGGIGSEVEYTLDFMLPANIIAWVTYEIPEGNAVVYAGGMLEEADILELRDMDNLYLAVEGQAYAGGETKETDVLELRDPIAPYAFKVTEGGHLIVMTDSEETNGFRIDRDGHLIMDSGIVENADRYRINDDGYLVYRME